MARMNDELITDIRRRAVEARVTMTQVFRQAGLSPTLLHNWAKRNVKPRPLTVAKLYDALDALAKENGR
jgi:DNA-binding phage protein